MLVPSESQSTQGKQDYCRNRKVLAFSEQFEPFHCSVRLLKSKLLIHGLRRSTCSLPTHLHSSVPDMLCSILLSDERDLSGRGLPAGGIYPPANAWIISANVLKPLNLDVGALGL